MGPARCVVIFVNISLESIHQIINCRLFSEILVHDLSTSTVRLLISHEL